MVEALGYRAPARYAARPRRWTNPAHYATPIWKLCLFGFSLGVGSMGVGEILLSLSA